MIKSHAITIMLGVICLFQGQLHPIACDVINQLQEAALSKRLWVACRLEKNDLMLLKENVSFSSDNPAITISAIRFASAPENLFVAAFDQHKYAFKRSVNCALDLACDGDEQQINDMLSKTTFFIEGMVVRRKGQVRPFTQKIILKDGLVFAKPQWEKQDALALASAPVELAPMAVMWLKPPTVFNDFIEWQSLLRVLNMLSDYCKQLLASFFTSYGFLLLFGLLALTIIKDRFLVLAFIWRFNAGRTRDIQVLCIVLLVVGLLVAVGDGVRADMRYSINLLLCCLGMLYAFAAPAKLVTFFEKVKVLLGLIMGSLVPPLVLKLCLLHYGL
jgi:hypothetical protein